MGHRRYGTDGKGSTEYMGLMGKETLKTRTDVNGDTEDMGMRGNVSLKIWDRSAKVGEVPTFRPSDLPIPIPIFRLYRLIFLVDFST
jgi:hypothetical protein